MLGGTKMEIRKTTNLEFSNDLSIVFIIGMPGSGKSTFASRYLSDFSVVDIDNIYDETENLLNLKKKSKVEQMLLVKKFFETLQTRLEVAIRHSLRKNPITFVIVNLTYKSSRKSFIQKFSARFRHCYAIVLDIDKDTVIKQYQNDEYNEGMQEFLANFDDFKSQIEHNSFEEFDTVYILQKTMLDSITITVV